MIRYYNRLGIDGLRKKIVLTERWKNIIVPPKPTVQSRQPYGRISRDRVRLSSGFVRYVRYSPFKSPWPCRVHVAFVEAVFFYTRPAQTRRFRFARRCREKRRPAETCVLLRRRLLIFSVYTNRNSVITHKYYDVSISYPYER